MRSDIELSLAEQAVEGRLAGYFAAGDPDPAFVERLQRQLSGAATGAVSGAAPSRPVQSGSWRFSRGWQAVPVRVRWASAFAALLIVLAVVIAALGPQRVWAEVQRLLGYVPGVGFVDLAETRVLVAPAEATRGAVTVRVEQVIAEPDKTRVVVRSEGLPREDALLPAGAAVAASGPDAFALRLPDGRALTTTEYALRWGAGTFTFPALPPDVFAATLELARLPLLPAGAAPEGWRIGRTLQPATGPLVAALFPEPYQPASASDAHHGITVSVVDVAHSPNETVLKLRGAWQNRDWEIRGLGGGMHLPALRDDVGHVYGWARSSSSGSTVVREVVSVPPPPEGPTPARRGLVIEQELALAPLSALAHDLTLELADIEAEAPAAGSFQVAIPAGARIGDAWPLDVRLNVAGFPVHITGAHLYEETYQAQGGDLRQTVLGLIVAAIPHQDGARLAIFWIDSPSPAWRSGPGSLNLGEGYMSVSLAQERNATLATGGVDVEVKGARIILHGPWRMHWQIPVRAGDGSAPAPLRPSDATDRHHDPTLQLVEAVHTDRLTQLQIDLKDPPAGVQLGGLPLWDARMQTNGLAFEDDRGRRYEPVSPNTQWRRTGEATFDPDRPQSGAQSLVLPPVDPLARRFTVTFPAIEVIRPGAGSFVVTVPENVELKPPPIPVADLQSEPWRVDIELKSGGYDVVYTQATISRRRSEMWLLLGNPDATVRPDEITVSGLCNVSVTGPCGEPVLSSQNNYVFGLGACTPSPGFAVQDAAGRLAPGEYRVSFDGIAVRVPGLWRLSWERQ